MNNRDDEHADWNSATQALVRAARRVHDPSATDRARVDAALATRLSAAQQIGAGTAGKATDLRSLLRLGALLKVAPVALFIAAGLLVSMFVSERRPAPVIDERVPAPGLAAVAPQEPQSPQVASPAPAPLAPAEVARASEVRWARPARPRANGPKHATKARESRAEPEVSAVPGNAAPAADLAEAQRAPSPPDRSEQASKPDAVQAPAASDATASPAVAASKAEPTHPRALATTARPKLSDASHAELKLVADMHAALTRADFPAVLALCAEHARRWPSGDFALEREGVRAIAGCKSHATEADAQAKRFLAEHPQTPVALRVRAACAPQAAATRAP